MQEVLTDVLLGNNLKQVVLDKLSKQPLFARFNSLSYQWLSWLIDKELIYTNKSLKYPVLKPTCAGNNYQQFITKKDLLNLKKDYLTKKGFHHSEILLFTVYSVV